MSKTHDDKRFRGSYAFKEVRAARRPRRTQRQPWRAHGVLAAVGWMVICGLWSA